MTVECPFEECDMCDNGCAMMSNDHTKPLYDCNYRSVFLFGGLVNVNCLLPDDLLARTQIGQLVSNMIGNYWFCGTCGSDFDMKFDIDKNSLKFTFHPGLDDNHDEDEVDRRICDLLMGENIERALPFQMQPAMYPRKDFYETYRRNSQTYNANNFKQVELNYDAEKVTFEIYF